MIPPWDKCGSLSVEQIRTKLAEIRPPERDLSHGVSLRAAAVLVPLACDQGDLHLLFTRRTDLVHDHKGQVAFPGGAVEPQDSSVEDTALRETYEEIGIPPEEICVLGYLPAFPTITGFLIWYKLSPLLPSSIGGDTYRLPDMPLAFWPY